MGEILLLRIVHNITKITMTDIVRSIMARIFSVVFPGSIFHFFRLCAIDLKRNVNPGIKNNIFDILSRYYPLCIKLQNKRPRIWTKSEACVLAGMSVRSLKVCIEEEVWRGLVKSQYCMQDWIKKNVRLGDPDEQ